MRRNRTTRPPTKGAFSSSAILSPVPCVVPAQPIIPPRPGANRPFQTRIRCHARYRVRARVSGPVLPGEARGFHQPVLQAVSIPPKHLQYQNPVLFILALGQGPDEWACIATGGKRGMPSKYLPEIAIELQLISTLNSYNRKRETSLCIPRGAVAAGSARRASP